MSDGDTLTAAQLPGYGNESYLPILYQVLEVLLVVLMVEPRASCAEQVLSNPLGQHLSFFFFL